MYEGEAPVSGKQVVIGIFLLAGVLTTVMVVYWRMHIEPFDPLRRAIDARFPQSFAIVEGGQRRMDDESSPKLLRVTMFVDFPLRDESAKRRHAANVAAVCRENFDFDGYDLLEVHMLGTTVDLRKTKKRPPVRGTATIHWPVSRVLKQRKN